MYYYIILSIGIICNVLAQFILKIGMKTFQLSANSSIFLKAKETIFNPYIAGAVIFYGLGFVAYAVALKNIELSRAYPVASVAMIILIFILSVLFLNESLTATKIIGIVLSLLGIFFIISKV